MKYLVLLLLLTSCVKSTYITTHQNGIQESFELWSLFKSVDGLSVIRTPELFGLKIDQTHTTTDVISDVAKILEFYRNPL